MTVNFDDKLKAIAKNENARVPDGFNGRIDSLVGSLREQKARRQPRLRGTQIAAAIIAVCLLAGGTVYAGVNGWITLNWDGAPHGHIAMEEVPADADSASTTITDLESSDYLPLIRALAPNEVYRIVAENGDAESGGTGPEIESLEEMRSLLADSVIPYGLPAALPEGYSFESASVQFGLSPELIDPGAAPVRTQVLEDGRTFEVFALPDGYRRYVEYYSVDYVDANGNKLNLTAHPMDKDADMAFGATQAGKAEKLEIPGYAKALYISDDPDKFEYPQMLYAQKAIEDTAYMDVFALDYANTPAGQRGAPFEAGCYNSVIYNLAGTNISRQALVDILASIV